VALAATAILVAPVHATAAPSDLGYFITESDAGALSHHVKQHPDQFSGFWYESDTNRFVVAVPGGAKAADVLEELRDVVPPRSKAAAAKRVELTGKTRSLSELNAVLDQVTAKQRRADGSAAFSGLWAVSERKNEVVVETAGEPAEVAAALGADLAAKVSVVRGAKQNRTHVDWQQMTPDTKVVKVSRSELAAQAAPNRRIDAWPYYTGHRIVHVVDNRIGSCTAAAVNTPRTHMYTAGHCYNQDALVEQGWFDQSTNTLYTTGDIGRVTSRQWGNGRIDAETVQIQGSGLYTDQSYYGTVVDPSNNTAFIKFDEFGGMRVCGNGSTSGTACYGELTETNICVFYEREQVTACGLTRARSMNGTRLSAPGDSGGAVVRDFFGSGVQVVGIISGGNDNLDMFYTPMRPACAQVTPFTCS
jgi:hypothetical protein